MKTRILTIRLVCLCACFIQIVQAQVASYNVIKSCNNEWDSTMNAWRGWTKWEEIRESNYTDPERIEISNGAIRVTNTSGYFDKKADAYLYFNRYSIYTFTGAVASGEYKMYQNAKVTYTHSYNESDNPKINITKTFIGSGLVYSKYLTLEQLVLGNAVGDITFFKDLGQSDRGYYARNINPKTVGELTQEKEDIEAAAEERLEEAEEKRKQKAKEKSDSYKKMGEALKIIL